jgi:AcrR family transcriptional regulator
MRSVPRVSEAHLAARRDQILEAAGRCFARNGFHATSMQDVIREAGLSVGAVYRYFKGKDELVRAIADQNVGRIGVALDELAHHEPPLPVGEVIDRTLKLVEPLLVRYGMATIALQVWAESLRDPELGDFVRANYARLRGAVVTAIARSRDAGQLPAGIDPELLGTAVFSLLPGYLVQRVLTGHPSRELMAAGVRMLLTNTIGAPPDAGTFAEPPSAQAPDLERGAVAR